MPTAARLVAFVTFAIVTYIATDYYIMELPEGTKVKWFREMNAVIGGIAAWRSMGVLAGQGYSRALTSGFRAICTILFYLLLTHGIIQMIKKAMKLLYDGPGDALIGLGELILKYGLLIVDSGPVMIVLGVGGALAALITEWTSHRWN
ncbi:TrgA family protein [Actibacterium sp. XHP0104]|uniref:TrgA family protein n=1 Tax=Actibacterium sp. XHP0104 TaxID=2984335 RepID=UPI0021E72B3E|nr:TrgA family protein [Actibacterium sp. XHP0104]MCV2880953.1 TrgA family protein [Actibacterium sp. XHP0104]